MKIRRYTGNNLQEAILKVKMDLGNDALILNTRKVRQKGLFKLFSKPMTEVLAAVDEFYGNERKDRGTSKTEEKNVTPEAKNEEKPIQDEKEEKITKLEDKVKSMESLLQRIYDNMKAPGKEAAAALSEVKQAERPQPGVLQVFLSNLVKNEVDSDLAEKLVESVSKKLGKETGMNEAASLLQNTISGILGKAETIELKTGKGPTVAIFVGPTGVGKTTTLAKIAANYLLNQKKSIGLITADTYRIAAVEQLKTYAEILGIPISVIYSVSEISGAIAQFSDKDLVLIDTAGRSHTNKSQFEELKTLVGLSAADEVFLVLSATTSTRSMKETISNYNFLKDYKLIFTKLDEAPASGIILNAKALTGKKLSYITNGQSVPDDIEVANADKLTKNLMGSIS